MFINEYIYKNIAKYKKTFFEEMRLLLPYFVKFFKDGFILEKNYLNNCIVKKLDQRLIIIIIYNKSIFLANNKH